MVLRLVDVDGMAGGDFGRRRVMFPVGCGVGGLTGMSGGKDCANFNGSCFSWLPSMSRETDVGRTDLKGELSADGSIS
jgi:hypothetical protein